MEKKFFCLTNFCANDRKDQFLLVFVCFFYAKISSFLNFPSNGNVRKKHHSANANSLVNMKFSYMIVVSKDEILYIALE